MAEKPHLMTPSYGGGHNWNPMSYSPLTGLVYMPAMEQWMVESRLPDGQYKYVLGQSTLAAGVNNYPELRKQLNAAGRNEARQGLHAGLGPGAPAARPSASPIRNPGNGGTLTTAGNLLVQGTINRTLAIYRADNGKKLWEMPVESVPVAGPMTLRGRRHAIHRRQRGLEQRHHSRAA